MYQIKRRTKAVSSLKILAALGLTLGLSSWALGQDCGMGDFVSTEACLVDGDSDTVNGGCNSGAAGFPFEAAVVGGSISGTVSTYLSGGACPHDLTGDGTVNTSDLLNLFANWGPQDPGHPADFNGDNVVNTSDLLALFANWGPCPPPATPTRDTDWYLVSPEQLAAADTDGNGLVVLSHTGTSEVPVVLFIVSIGGVGDPLCTGAAVIGVTGWAGDVNNTHCIGGSPSEALIDIADHPHGIVFYVAPGQPSGASITSGYPCSDPPHDYNVELTISELNEACTFEGEPCNVATPGVPGCNDPVCCDLVCTDFDPGCCDFQWDDFCVEFATNEDFAGCAPGIGAPVFIATGSDNSVDGYLDLFADGYGSEAVAFGGGPNWIDNYNPVDGGLQNPGFTTSTFLFTGGTDRLLLSLHEGSIGAWSGSTMAAAFLDPTVASDVSGNGINDTVVNHFGVTGALTLDVIATQSVETLTAEGGSPIANWTLSYEIRNDGAAATFDVVRWIDADSGWVGGAGDDSVGTGTNAGGGCDHYVYTTEVGFPNFGITLSTNAASALYVGSKLGVDPDCGGPIIPFGFGTDGGQYWSAFGMPTGWEDIIATVGNATDGESGSAPPDGCGNTGNDASIGIFATVTLGAGETTTVTFVQTYGAITPNGAICSK